MERELQQWAQLYLYTITKCIIQADTAEFVGWIAYSSYFTEIEKIKSTLTKKSNFEWGFKMIAVNDSNKDKKWNKRVKALGIYVPTKNTNVAISLLGKLLEAEEENKKFLPTYINRFLYVPPKDMIDNYDSRIAYNSVITRHRIHQKSLQAKFTTDIKIDIDKELVV